MIETWKKSELDRVMRAHGFRYSKAWGQNFLVDKNILDNVVAAAELTPDDHVVEIGPGAGALTILLAEAAGHVTAVEIDKRLIPLLEEVTEGLANITIVRDDFLKVRHNFGALDLEQLAPSLRFDRDSLPAMRDLSDFSQRGEKSPGFVSSETRCPLRGTSRLLAAQDGPPKLLGCKLVGNLPYYITTPIIAGMFEPGADGARPVPPELAVFMVQKEVAERLMSPPGKKAYGAISVLVQYYSEIELLHTVSRDVFTPRPTVDSAVIRLRPRDLSGDDPETAARMFRLVRAGFDMRRKTLKNSLAASGFPRDALAAALDLAGIDPVRRAETLSPRDFYTVAGYLV